MMITRDTENFLSGIARIIFAHPLSINRAVRSIVFIFMNRGWKSSAGGRVSDAWLKIIALPTLKLVISLSGFLNL